MSQFSVRHHQLDQAGNPKPLESLLPLWPIQNQLWTHNCTIPNTDCTVSRLKWGQTDLSTIIYTISKFQLRSHNFDQYHTVASRPELREVAIEWATVTMLHYFPHVCIVLYCFCICIRGDGRYVCAMILSLIGKGDMDDAILSHWHCVLIHPWTGMQTYLYSIQCGVWITHAHSNCFCICVRVFSPFYSTTHFDQLCYLACWERGVRSN